METEEEKNKKNSKTGKMFLTLNPQLNFAESNKKIQK